MLRGKTTKMLAAFAATFCMAAFAQAQPADESAEAKRERIHRQNNEAFGNLVWDNAHELAVRAAIGLCEEAGGEPSPLPQAERDKWSTWLNDNAAKGWTKIRQNPNASWKYAAMRCKRGSEESIRLIWAFPGPWGMAGVLGFMEPIRDKEPSIVVTRPTSPEFAKDWKKD